MSIDPVTYTEIEFGYVYPFELGGMEIWLGQILPYEDRTPILFAAALNEHDVRQQNKRGFGTTEAEAVADLFRKLG